MGLCIFLDGREDDVGRGQVNKARYSADIEQMMRQTKVYLSIMSYKLRYSH